MRISESHLREIIRNYILETKKDDDKNVLGEPDESKEEDRDSADLDVDEVATLASGGISGYQGSFDYDPENPLYYKKKKKKKNDR